MGPYGKTWNATAIRLVVLVPNIGIVVIAARVEGDISNFLTPLKKTMWVKMMEE